MCRLIVVFIIVGSLTAAVSVANETAVTPFLNIGISARAIGMGDAFCGLANDGSAVFYNPAGLNQRRDTEILFAYNHLYLDTYQGAFGLARKIGKRRSIGLAMSYLQTKNIEARTGPTDEPESFISASNALLSLSYAQTVATRFRIGLGLKTIYEKLHEESANAFAFDMGTMYTIRNFGVGIAVQNIGQKMKFVQDAYSLPSNLKVGLRMGPIEELVTITGDIEKGLTGSKAAIAHIGGEVNLYKNILLIRGGYSRSLTEDMTLNSYAAGFGISVRNIEIDYAFMPYTELGSTHRISLSSMFGKLVKPPIREKMPLFTERVILEDIFPSKFRRYAKESLFMVKLTNNTPNWHENVKVSINIPGYMSLPSENIISEIAPKESKEVYLSVVLNPEEIYKISEDRPVSAEIKIVWVEKNEEREYSITKPLTIYNRNAIDWTEKESIASFITPNDDPVKSFVRKAIRELKQDMSRDLPPNIANAVALFDALSTHPITYVKDPTSKRTEEVTLDYVNYPRETLKGSTGDCDDLSALFASCLENIGIPTAMVYVPGHIFILFNTGVFYKNAERIGLNKELYVVKNNYIWLPVEATLLGHSFYDALQKGAESYNSWLAANRLDVITISSASEMYPSASLPFDGWEPELPDTVKLKECFREDQKEFVKKKGENIDQEIAFLQGKISKNPKEISARNKLGIIYAKNQEFDKAIKEFKDIIRIDKKFAGAYVNLGNIYMEEEKYKQALKYYTRAAKLDPMDGGIYYNIGLVYRMMGNPDKASVNFKKAVELFPDLPSISAAIGFDLNALLSKLKKEGIELSDDEIRSFIIECLVKAPKEKKIIDISILLGETKGEDVIAEKQSIWIMYWK